MNLFELIAVGFALAADSFVAALTVGIDVCSLSKKEEMKISSLFALFQSLMPVLGYLLTHLLGALLMSIDHFISFAVLFFLGVSMIREEKKEDCLSSFSFFSILILSIAVTIDAFTVGITYSLLQVSLSKTILINFSVTFITTMVGLKIGYLANQTLKKKAKVLGGLVLISLAIKILLTHLGIL